MKRLTLVTGGGRSGKSCFALSLAAECTHKVFIATATAFDQEMDDRIKKHKADRDPSFVTIEEPLALADAILKIPDGTDVAVIDCLTVWLGNVFHAHPDNPMDGGEVDAFLGALEDAPCDLIVVTNELGLGVIPENKLAREFRDAAGFLNQRMAERADEVTLLISGIPMTLKKGKNE